MLPTGVMAAVTRQSIVAPAARLNTSPSFDELAAAALGGPTTQSQEPETAPLAPAGFETLNPPPTFAATVGDADAVGINAVKLTDFPGGIDSDIPNVVAEEEPMAGEFALRTELTTCKTPPKAPSTPALLLVTKASLVLAFTRLNPADGLVVPSSCAMSM